MWHWAILYIWTNALGTCFLLCWIWKLFELFLLSLLCVKAVMWVVPDILCEFNINLSVKILVRKMIAFTIFPHIGERMHFVSQMSREPLIVNLKTMSQTSRPVHRAAFRDICSATMLNNFQNLLLFDGIMNNYASLGTLSFCLFNPRESCQFQTRTMSTVSL